MLEAFLRHRREVVTRRTVHDLRKARSAAIFSRVWRSRSPTSTEMIATIKASPSPAEAKVALVSKVWMPGAVPEIRSRRAGAINTRPDGETSPLGLTAGGYRLTEIQAQAILDMRLNRLTGLERTRSWRSIRSSWR